jgi:hypothetical protein
MLPEKSWQGKSQIFTRLQVSSLRLNSDELEVFLHQLTPWKGWILHIHLIKVKLFVNEKVTVCPILSFGEKPEFLCPYSTNSL